MTTKPRAEPQAPNAYLLNVSIGNLRCFSEPQTLDLSDGAGRPARWTVILGDNGVGKTSLLQAIALLTSRFPIPADNPLDALSAFEGHQWERIRFGRSVRDPAQEIVVRGEFSTIRALLDSPEQARRFSGALQWTEGRSGVSADSHELTNWECFGYGALRRPTPLTRLSRVAAILNSETLFRDDGELVNAEEWLLQADYAAARQERRQTGVAARLALVKKTLVETLPDVEDVYIEDDPQDPGATPVVVFRTVDGPRTFESLGLGYRTTIAWLVDLAARLVRRYPDSSNPLAEPAVALIDEIDLHLHPTWQRNLMSFLSERFVNTQFIVTAHSPVVVQAATDANIAVLRREGDHVVIDQRPRSVQGWRVDQLLTSDLFDLPSARSARYDDLLAERRGLLEKRRLTTEEMTRLRALEDRMNELPSGEDPAEADALRVIREAAETIKRQGAARD